jgi:hypothetical protein
MLSEHFCQSKHCQFSWHKAEEKEIEKIVMNIADQIR